MDVAFMKIQDVYPNHSKSDTSVHIPGFPDHPTKIEFRLPSRHHIHRNDVRA